MTIPSTPSIGDHVRVETPDNPYWWANNVTGKVVYIGHHFGDTSIRVSFDEPRTANSGIVRDYWTFRFSKHIFHQLNVTQELLLESYSID
jgi:hypothetical protein